MSNKTYKNFFDDGYTTHHENGSKSKTYKNYLDDGYTTYHENGSKSKTYKNYLDDGYTTYHENGDVSKTYKNVLNDGYTTYHQNANDAGAGGTVFAVIYSILAIALVSVIYFGIAIQSRNTKIGVCLLVIVLTIIVWKIIVTEKNKPIVDDLLMLIRDLSFGAACHFALPDYSPENIILWFCGAFIGLGLMLLIPGNKKCEERGMYRLEGMTYFLNFFRPIVAWASPFIVVILNPSMLSSYKSIYTVLFLIILIPSIISIIISFYKTIKNYNHSKK